MRTTFLPTRPAQAVLELDEVEGCDFWGDRGLWTGIVTIDAGQELDVSQVSKRKWYASDDSGTRHYGRTVKAAVAKAIKANPKGG